jgi:hypothetical protein
MKNLKLILFLSAVSVFSIVSCKKGDTGPAGPQGPAGPDSVTYSDWITLAMENISGDTVFHQAITAPAVTQAVLDSGIILSYAKGTDGYVYHASDVGIYPAYAVGVVDVLSFYNDWSGTAFRYVVVPGSISAGNISSGPAKGLTTKQLKDMSYKDVEKLLNLSDKSSSY